MAIRVLLDASTRLVRSALKATLGECADIEIVEGSVSSNDIDVIVVQQRLFQDYPALTDATRIGIVAIDDDGICGDVYRIRHNGWRFTPGPAGGLADAIRAVASAS